MVKIPWIALFSQTGSEIANIAEKIGHWPDLIIVNERDVERTIDSRLQGRNVVFVPNRPSEDELRNLFMQYKHPLITLHGWLRIIPPTLCSEYNIYNGHPGLITKFPELKGKDPQIRAIQGDYTLAGCVLHIVTPGVDEGRIVLTQSFSIEGLGERECFRIFSETSLKLWVRMLNTLFNIKLSPHERARLQ